MHILQTSPQQVTACGFNNADQPIIFDSGRNTTKLIIAGKLFDPYEAAFHANQVIEVCTEKGLILDVRPLSKDPDQLTRLLTDPKTVDLRDRTVVPGFVDAHVHLFLHSYKEASGYDQMTQETVAERTVRATVHARETLMAGFTTVRDLGTEGAEDADIALRKCMSGPNALIPGPRYFTANRALVCTGSYGPKSALHVNQEGTDGARGAEACDGVDGCRIAVRRQISAGADWIKLYADYSLRSRMSDVAPTVAANYIPTFTPEELEAIITEAHRHGVKVAAHAFSPTSIAHLIRLGVDTIEHGAFISQSNIDRLSASHTAWCPTVAVFESSGRDELLCRMRDLLPRAVEAGVRFACGGDTGAFPHGENAREARLMRSLSGAPVKTVLQWLTLRGWEVVRSLAWERLEGKARLARVEELGEARGLVGDNEMPFGAIRKGFSADLVALAVDPEVDFDEALKPANVSFVMKMGRVYKQDGLPVL